MRWLSITSAFFVSASMLLLGCNSKSVGYPTLGSELSVQSNEEVMASPADWLPCDRRKNLGHEFLVGTCDGMVAFVSTASPGFEPVDRVTLGTSEFGDLPAQSKAALIEERGFAWIAPLGDGWFAAWDEKPLGTSKIGWCFKRRFPDDWARMPELPDLD